MNKIFGIGLPRTGTKSLINLLKESGYSAVHNPKNFDRISKFKAAADIFVTINWKELDKMYPNSKFILTTRNKGDWLDSCARKFSVGNNPLRKECFGTEHYQQDIFENVWETHLKDVKQHFKNRPNDLFILDLDSINENVLNDLSMFLELNKPILKFPHVGL